MIYHQHCPVCKSGDIKALFSAKDFTVSLEMFVIARCNSCTAMFTQDAPTQGDIYRYYASDNYVSHSNTQKGLVNRLYHIVRNRTLISKRRLVEKETGLAGGEILDIGCGTGAFLNELKKSGWNITGLEPDDTARRNAVLLFDIHPIESNEIFNLPVKKYQAITMWHVLEHVHQLQEYICRLGELLSPDGVLFIAVPNYTAGDALHYGEGWAAYDVPRHLYHFSPQSIKVLLKLHQLEVNKMKPMWYDAFYVSLLSEKNIYGRTNFIRAAWQGLKSNFAALKNPAKCSSVIYIIRKKSI